MGFWDGLVQRLKTDMHVPIALGVFAVTTTYHFVARVDLGPQYVNSIYAMYAFLGGHAWVNGKFGNGGGDKPPQQ